MMMMSVWPNGASGLEDTLGDDDVSLAECGGLWQSK